MRWERCLFASLVLAVACGGTGYPLRNVAYSEIVGSASINLATPPSIRKGDHFSVPIVVDLASVTMPKVIAAGGRLQVARQSAALGTCEIDLQYDPAVLKLASAGDSAAERGTGLVTLNAPLGARSGVVTVAVLEFEVVGQTEMTTLTVTPRKVATPEIPGLGSYSIPNRGSTISVLFFGEPTESAARARSEKP